MAAGRFDRELPLPPQGPVPIKGPFDPQDSAVDAAKVLFLIVQGDGQNTLIVNGEGTWQRADGNERPWSGKAPRTGPLVGGGMGTLERGLARGIALSVVIKPGEVFDSGRRFEPPAIETLMWCANFHFV
jgi:hypothetical protein